MGYIQMTVQEQIEKLTAIISNEINELVLVDSGREVLENLLESIGSEKHLFSNYQFLPLNSIANTVGMIK